MRVQAARTAGTRAGGFTLVEVLFVVIIIGLIAAIAVPRLGKAFGKGQVKTTVAQMARLSAAVEEFKADVMRYPTEQEGLKALVEKPQGVDAWKGPYLDRRVVPKDGWNHDFHYRLDDTFGFLIKSLGADGKEGGEGDNADLDNRS
ncbi:MAG: type II secretion system major pseudopilin GspG [Planctomycetota bacterium]|nr:type II secretion system major pseudopilin GspG [Planctomycetota bacterium]